MFLGYSEMFLGEGWCSGVPFSSEDGTTTTFGDPLTTDAMFQAGGRALRHGARAGRDERERVSVRIADRQGSRAAQPRQVRRGGGGRGRRADDLRAHHVALGEQQQQWHVERHDERCVALQVDDERRQERPAVPRRRRRRRTRASTGRRRRASDSAASSRRSRTRTSSAQYSDGIITTGAEARLIELEAQLQADTQAARDAVFAGHQHAAHRRCANRRRDRHQGDHRCRRWPVRRRPRRTRRSTCSTRSARTGCGSPAIASATCAAWSASTSATLKPCSRPAVDVDVSARRLLRHQHVDHGSVLGKEQPEVQGCLAGA